MATAKKLQIPGIIKFVGAILHIAHPDIAANPRTYLRSSIAAAGTAMTVADNSLFIDDDWFIVGELGDAKTEEDDVNGTPTRGQTLTVTNTLKFSHDIDSPVTKIYERQIKVYGTNTSGVAGTQVGSTKSIAWDKEHTEFLIASGTTAYTYYYCTFYDGTTESSSSNEVTYSTGLPANAIQWQVDAALEMTGERIDESGDITRAFLLEQCNKWQDSVAQYIEQSPSGDKTVKDWPFELIEDLTSLTIVVNQEEYALSSLTTEMKYPNSNQGIKNVRIGTTKSLDYIDPAEMDDEYEDTARTQLEVAAGIGDTSITLDDSADFNESGSIYLGSEIITYTANAQSTGVLSGIPASGTGSITATHAIDSWVWQNVSPGLPDKYTIILGKIRFNKPIDSDYEYQKIKMRYLKKLTRLDNFTDTTEIPFYNTLETFLRSRIELKKGNRDEANNVLLEFQNELKSNAASQFVVPMDSVDYHTFSGKELSNSSTNDD